MTGVCVGACLAAFWIPLPPSSLSFELFSDFTLGLQGDDPKGREGPGERCPETSLTCTHSASELRKTRENKKPTSDTVCAPTSLFPRIPALVSFSSALKQPYLLASRLLRTGGLEVQWALNSGPSTFKPYDLKQSVFSVSYSVK